MGKAEALRGGPIPGLTGEFRYLVPVTKTVPRLYPESDEFRAMPEVLATGFLVGLLDWACVRTANPHLDRPAEQTVGVYIDVSHVAPTPPGLEITVEVELVEVEGRHLTVAVHTHDGVDLISTGTHRRFVIDRPCFDQTVAAKTPTL